MGHHQIDFGLSCTSWRGSPPEEGKKEGGEHVEEGEQEGEEHVTDGSQDGGGFLSHSEGLDANSVQRVAVAKGWASTGKIIILY